MIFIDICEHCDTQITFGPDEWHHVDTKSFMCNWDNNERDFSQPMATPTKIDVHNVDLVYSELDKLGL